MEVGEPFGAGVIRGALRAMSGYSLDNERDAKFWRKLEAEVRTIAAGMSDPEFKRRMLFIAEGYKLLADRAAFRKSQKD